MKIRNVETITHIRFSLKTLLYIITKTQASKYHEKYNLR